MTRSLSHVEPVEPSPNLDAAAAAIEQAAQLGRSETIASIAVPAPVVSAETVARAFGDELRLLWRDKAGDLTAGLGVAALACGTGPGRFAEARDAARNLYRRIAGTKRPLFGGFAFEPGAADNQTWSGFGDARFELPAVSYSATTLEAELRVNVSDPLNSAFRREALAELERRSDRLRQLAAVQPEGTPPPHSFRQDSEADRRRYLELVNRARDLVRSGRYKKLVTARSRTIELDKPLEVASLLGRIDASYPDCTLLLVAGENGSLIAATPERLATIQGDRVETVALAGTVPLKDAASLHSDAKLQLEHRLTVDAISDALRTAPGTCDVHVERVPRLCRLRNLVHLETPITARLVGDAHIFDVAASLHPTPAVAGIPTREACGFLREAEGMARGWYAGLVGWCNERGEGELVVALRAGLVRGSSVELFAGAGIVGDSVPETEWDETALKLSALEAHLGGVGQ